MDGEPGAIGLERTRVGSGDTFGFGQRGVVRSRGARRREECTVGLLRGMREVTLEVIEEDRRASLCERKGVAPEPQRKPEPQVRAEKRVRALAREIRGRARHADAD